MFWIIKMHAIRNPIVYKSTDQQLFSHHYVYL